MARMHSRKKGKSGSTRSLRKSKPSWIRHKDNEIEQLVVKLAKSGKTPSKIGIFLRDSYGIYDVKKLTGKKINKILEENDAKLKVPEDFKALIKKEILLIKHLEKNKHDMPSKRGLLLTESKIKRLAKYYKKVGKLPKDWKYSREEIKLLE
ncbi:30S ribosomal protein S15 [archaeon]|nr:30S ribosomal protein S15 [archaeon]